MLNTIFLTALCSSVITLVIQKIFSKKKSKNKCNLYVPNLFDKPVSSKQSSLQLIKNYNFAILINCNNSNCNVSHVPIHVSTSGHKKLLLHLAKANPHSLALEEFAQNQEGTCKIIFSGPHGYISPKWYNENWQNQVPTWNFAAIHVNISKCRLITNDIEKMSFLQTMCNENEEYTLKRVQQLEEQGISSVSPIDANAYKMEQANKEYIAMLLKEITVFELDVDNIEEKWKLSQNKSDEMRSGVIDGLLRLKTDEATALAAYMKLDSK